MANITQRGRELADRICRIAEPATYPDAAICSLIARHAVSLHHVYEATCNGHPAASDPRVSAATAGKLQHEHEIWCIRRERQLEAQIRNLAAWLPGISSVRFCGDPRGAPVRLVTLNGRGDSWDEPKSICVP